MKRLGEENGKNQVDVVTNKKFLFQHTSTYSNNSKTFLMSLLSKREVDPNYSLLRDKSHDSTKAAGGFCHFNVNKCGFELK